MKPLVFAVNVLLLLEFGAANPCTLSESLDISHGTVLQNRSVFMYGIEFTNKSWYEVGNETDMVRYGCPCIDRVCLWKCCQENRAFYNLSCEESGMSEVNPFNLPLYKEMELTGTWSKDVFFHMYGWPCEDRYLVDTASNNEDLYIQEDGQLLEISIGGPQWQPATKFCVDMMTNDLSVSPRLVAGICFPETEVTTDDSKILYTAYAIGLMLSVPFLVATFLVYALIPELRNLHGLCLMAYCGGLIIGYSFLAYLKLHIGRVGVAMTGCLAIAFIVYCAFQTSFFWLNIMCFDIWRTFRGYRGGSTNKRRERKRFALYAIYAWGTPVLLTACTAAMQFSDLPDNIIKPGFGSKRCWFVSWLSELVYFFTPVLILVMCNVTFFIVTAYRIRSIKQETAILKGAESFRSDRLSKDKQRYSLYLKLFMVMGVNWTVEMISFAVGGSNWYWIMTDLSNVALGIFIFFIFVWKKKVRQLVQRRFRNMFGLPPAQGDGRTARWNTSSAPTEDTRVSGDDSAIRLKEIH